MREEIHRVKVFGKVSFCRGPGPGTLRRLPFLIPGLLMICMLPGCTGRSLIPESMIPRALRGEETTAFAGPRAQDRDAAGREEYRTDAPGGRSQESGSGDSSQGQDTLNTEDGDVYVHVCGHVKKPGVYKLSGGSRICDAIEAAGGLDKEADSSWWNQAAPVTDGMQVRVPSKKEVESGMAGFAAGSVTGEESSGMSGTARASKGGAAGDCVNINTAGPDQLMTIPGIGAKRAEDIINFREEHGNFSSVEDIRNVPGIGDGIYNRMKDHIRVG